MEVKRVDNVIYTPDLKVLPNRGVGCVYFEEMSKNKDKIAQIDGLTGEKDTHGDLLQRSIRVALTMRDKGIKYGDFVSLCTINHLNSGVPHIASFFIGAKIAAIDPSLSASDALYLLKNISPKMIFVSLEGVELVEKVVEQLGTKIEIVVFGATEKHTPFANFLANHQDEVVFKPVDVNAVDETAMVVFSSGTAGQPKGVCFSHLNMLYRPIFGDTSATISYALPYWSVFITFLHTSIVKGGTRIVYPYFDEKNPWQTFKYEVDFAFLNTTQVLTLIRTERPSYVNLKNIKLLAVGGSYLSMQSRNEIISALPNVPVTSNYGMSEVFSGTVMRRSDNISSVGTILPFVSYKVVDPETEKVLGPNEVGELRLKSKSQCSGYLHEEISSCFDSDGWLKTGDLFYYDDNLDFFYVDRLKESFKYFNHFITPKEIESVIMTHESIEVAVVFGKPSEFNSNDIMAAVKLWPHAKEVTAAEIEKYVEERVEDRKRLRGGVVIVDNIPRTTTGKIHTLQLKKMILNKNKQG